MEGPGGHYAKWNKLLNPVWVTPSLHKGWISNSSQISSAFLHTGCHLWSSSLLYPSSYSYSNILTYFDKPNFLKVTPVILSSFCFRSMVSAHRTSIAIQHCTGLERKCSTMTYLEGWLLIQGFIGGLSMSQYDPGKAYWHKLSQTGSIDLMRQSLREVLIFLSYKKVGFKDLYEFSRQHRK